MKRKIPFSYSLLGFMMHARRYYYIGLAGLVLLFIGIAGVRICEVAGSIVLAVYFIVCLVKQWRTDSITLKHSGHAEFDAFMDAAFGVTGGDSDKRPAHEKMIEIVNEKTNAYQEDSEPKNMP